jgi:hypothetical protein
VPRYIRDDAARRRLAKVPSQSTEKEQALNNSTVETRESEQELFFNDVTDEALEAAATAAGAAQSLWGTVTVSGCTCIE